MSGQAKPTVVVVGATSKQGSAVVCSLLDKFNVKAFTLDSNSLRARRLAFPTLPVTSLSALPWTSLAFQRVKQTGLNSCLHRHKCPKEHAYAASCVMLSGFRTPVAFVVGIGPFGPPVSSCTMLHAAPGRSKVADRVRVCEHWTQLRR